MSNLECPFTQAVEQDDPGAFPPEILAIPEVAAMLAPDATEADVIRAADVKVCPLQEAPKPMTCNLHLGSLGMLGSAQDPHTLKKAQEVLLGEIPAVCRLREIVKPESSVG
jgi:hypothetical protein